MEIAIQNQKKIKQSLLFLAIVATLLYFMIAANGISNRLYYTPPAPFPVQDSVIGEDGNLVPANP